MKQTDIKQRENYTELDQRIRKMQKEGGKYATKDEVEKVQQKVDKTDESAQQARADALLAQRQAKAAEEAAKLARQQANMAKETADNAKKEAETAKEWAEKAGVDSEIAKNAAVEASTAADNAAILAQQAQQAANEASAAVGAVEHNVEEIKTSVADAQAAATSSRQAAALSESKATQAAQSAQAAEEQATLAKAAADTANENSQDAVQRAGRAEEQSAEAKQQADAATENVELIKADVQQQEKDLEDYKNQLESFSNTMEAAYAKKTELSEVQSNLQSTIKQTAAGFSSTVEELREVDETNSTLAQQARQNALQAQEKADAAKQQADTATENASAAQQAANSAVQAAANAQAQAKAAQDAATASEAAAQQAEADLKTAQDELTAIRSDVSSTKEDVEAAEKAVLDAQQAVEDARAEAVSSAEKAAQAQTSANIATQNATVAQQQADAAALSASKAQEQAQVARGEATAAKNSAQQAWATAATAQQTAAAAKENAEKAREDARAAAVKAQAAETAAQQANADAQQAAADLATAKENLAKVESDINATNEEVEAAKQAVASAQSKADAAASAAATAQGTANTAKANAATAQTAANNAKTAADNAQAAADAAQDAADKAQADVNSLTARVTKAETQITQNTEQIELRATKTEVAQTLSGYYTKTQTDAAITTKANQITSTVEKTYQKTVSKGEQLITNGNGLMGDNTNFSTWTFDGAIANNSAGSFTKPAGSTGTYTSDEYFPVNPTNEYTFSLDAKSTKGVGKLYSMLMFFDADKQQISAGHHIYNAASTTTLAKDLKAGDTTIYLTSAAGWSTTYSYGFYMTIWNYKNSFGYTYPECTYSRNRLTLPKNGNYLNSANLNKNANTITLTTAYSGATIPAGTKVSQGGDGATYKYFPCSNTVIPTVWTSYSGKISGVDYSGQNKANTFPPGTAYAKLGFLWNYQGSGNGEQLWVTNLSVTDTTAASRAQAAADKAQTDVNVLSTRVTQTENSITSQASSISSLGTRISTVEQTASGLTISLQGTNAEIDKISSIKYLTTNYSYPLATLKSYAKDGTNAGTWAVTSSAGVRVGDTVYLRMTNSDTGSFVYLALTVQSVPSTTSVNGISHGFIDPGTIDVANNAAKTATNYLKFDSSGLLVGDMTASTLGKNVLIYSGGVNIRSGTTVLASFQADKIQLGNNSTSSVIEFCGGSGQLSLLEDAAGDKTLRLSSDYVTLRSRKTNGTATSIVYANSTYSDSEGFSTAGLHAEKSDGTNFATILAEAGSSIVAAMSVTSAAGSSQIQVKPTVIAISSQKIAMAGNVNVSYTGDLILEQATQANSAAIKWQTINSKNPYIGYATDQTDGTFVWSITGTNYASGLAIGGGSGNLLYKSAVVLHANNYTSYAVPTSRTVNGKALSSNISLTASDVGAAASSHSHSYLSSAGGTIVGTSGDTPLYVRSASTGTYIGIQNSSGTTLGYFGFSAANTPVVYIGSAKKILHEGNYTSYCATAGHTHSYLPLTGGTISGATTFSENVTFTKNIETKVAQVYALEISHATPFIDFHFGNSTADYTSRIIENSKGALTVSGTISQTSDRRLKENIMPLGIPQLMPVDGGAVETDLHSELFDRLNPVQYRFINGNGKICYGLIAQDVVEAMHEVGIEENSLDLVHHNFWTEKTGEEKEQYSVSYNSLIALLVHEVQKLKSELNIFKGEQLC